MLTGQPSNSIFLTEISLGTERFHDCYRIDNYHNSIDDLNNSIHESTSCSEDSLSYTQPNKVFQYINELISTEGPYEIDVTLSQPKYSPEERLSDLLDELDCISQWSEKKQPDTHHHHHIMTYNDIHGISDLLIHISIHDWLTAHPSIPALEYSLFLWSVGQSPLSQQQNISQFGMKTINNAEEARRGNLICTFKAAMEALLKIIHTIHISSSKLTSFQTVQNRMVTRTRKDSVTLEDIQIEMVDPHAKRIMWYFIHKCQNTSKLLISKSLSHLPNVKRRHFIHSETIEERKGDSEEEEEEEKEYVFKRNNRKNWRKNHEIEMRNAAIEAALLTGDALGMLVVSFILNSRMISSNLS